MNIDIINRSQLDTKKYDACVASSELPMLYAFSAHMDIVARRWKVVVLGDYDMVMPIVYNRKLLGLPQVYHPYYAQQLGAFGRYQRDVVVVKAMLEKVAKVYVRVSMQLNAANPLPKIKGWNFKQRTNYELDLSRPYATIQKGYRKGHKSSIKSSKSMNYMEQGSLSADAFAKIMAGWSVMIGLGQLMDLVALYGLDSIHIARLNNGEIGALGFFPRLSHFVTDKERIIYMVGYTTEAGRKAFSGHFLIDSVIESNAETNAIFDFEGSELPGVASFFKGFGPVNHPYGVVG